MWQRAISAIGGGVKVESGTVMPTSASTASIPLDFLAEHFILIIYSAAGTVNCITIEYNEGSFLYTYSTSHRITNSGMDVYFTISNTGIAISGLSMRTNYPIAYYAW